MQLQFLGHSGAFATSLEGNTNACLTVNGKRLLIDFGVISNIVWREHWGYSYNDIDSMFISHTHADHCCLEPFLFSRYFLPRIEDKMIVRPTIFANPKVIHEIWAMLSPSMSVYRNEIFHLSNFATCKACSDFTFEGVEFSLVRNTHMRSAFKSKDAFGLQFIAPSGNKIYWSSDSANINLPSIKWADIVFHDCENSIHPSYVHAHISHLMKLPAELRKKMWLMHYSGNVNEYLPYFAGAVVKNQIFNL